MYTNAIDEGEKEGEGEQEGKGEQWESKLRDDGKERVEEAWVGSKKKEGKKRRKTVCNGGDNRGRPRQKDQSQREEKDEPTG